MYWSRGIKNYLEKYRTLIDADPKKFIEIAMSDYSIEFRKTVILPLCSLIEIKIILEVHPKRENIVVKLDLGKEKLQGFYNLFYDDLNYDLLDRSEVNKIMVEQFRMDLVDIIDEKIINKLVKLTEVIWVV